MSPSLIRLGASPLLAVGELREFGGRGTSTTLTCLLGAHSRSLEAHSARTGSGGWAQQLSPTWQLNKETGRELGQRLLWHRTRLLPSRERARLAVSGIGFHSSR